MFGTFVVRLFDLTRVLMLWMPGSLNGSSTRSRAPAGVASYLAANLAEVAQLVVIELREGSVVPVGVDPPSPPSWAVKPRKSPFDPSTHVIWLAA
jgi:hypothetical protein